MATLKKHKTPVKSKHSRYEAEGAAYIAKLFGGGKISKDALDQIPDDFNPEAIIDSENTFDLVKIVGKSLDPHTGVPRNIKIPEGDFKEAKNFFDFCLNFRGPDAKFPFARQMWLMLMLFGEICPRCTNKKLFNIMNVPVGLDPKNIPNRIRLMNYGVCPRCKGQKSEFLKRSEINEYVEMSLCVGQRAGKSTTSAAGTEYLTHKYLMYPKMSSVCRGVSSATPLVATFVGYRFADAFSLLWDPVIKGIKDSPWFCLDENTQISLIGGSTKAIKDMLIGDLVPTLEGPSVVDNVFDNGIQECKTVVLEDGKSITGTDEHQVRCLSADGTSLVWKKIGEITEEDYVVTE